MLKRVAAALVLLSFMALGGCATYHLEKTGQAGQLPDTSGYKQRPSVYVDAHVYFGSSPDAEDAPENKAGTELFRTSVDKVVKDSNLFASHSLDSADGADYTIELKMMNHGDKGAAAAVGFVTGLTLGVIPGAATDNYRLTATVTDKSGKQVGQYVVDDAVKTWIGIWFLPVMGGHLPKDVVPMVWENMVRTAFKQMADDRAIRYAALPPSLLAMVAE